MKKIASFCVDHTRLQRGIFVSRIDAVGEREVTTFDIRMKEPNRERVLDGAVAHTIEHLGATLLRNHPLWADKVVYFGPMGCLTGFYMLLSGRYESTDVADLVREVFEAISEWTDSVPGATPHDCGNWAYQDLAGAKLEAKKFVDEILTSLGDANLNYPE